MVRLVTVFQDMVTRAIVANTARHIRKPFKITGR